MIFFVISRKGFEDYLSVKEKLAAPLWISAGVISKADDLGFHPKSGNITRCENRLNTLLYSWLSRP